MVTISWIISENRHKRAMACWYTCEKTDECPLFKDGKCACFRYIIGSNLKCPNAVYHVEIGPTKRAKSHYDWIAERKTRLQPNAKEFNQKIAETADHIFVPMAHLDTMSGQQVEGVVNEHFFCKDDFNAETVERIVRHRPHTLFDNTVIRSYVDKEIPKFLLQLKDIFPDIYEEWKAKYPESAEKYTEMSSVGRTAYISTLPDGCKVGCFVKNGDRLETDSYKDVLGGIRFGSNRPLTLSVNIEDDMTVKVTEQMLIDENVRYVD